MTAGVYIITNIVTGDRYVGQSRTLKQRMRGHQLLLEAGKHPNKHLQKDFQMYGCEMFAYAVLEVVDISDCLAIENWRTRKSRISSRLKAHEWEWCIKLQPEYNIVGQRYYKEAQT